MVSYVLSLLAKLNLPILFENEIPCVLLIEKGYIVS